MSMKKLEEAAQQLESARDKIRRLIKETDALHTYANTQGPERNLRVAELKKPVEDLTDADVIEYIGVPLTVEEVATAKTAMIGIDAAILPVKEAALTLPPNDA